MSGNPHQQYFESLTQEWDQANTDCQRTYAIWKDACERFQRIGTQRHRAFENMLMERLKTAEGREP